MISILLVAALAACIVYIVSLESVDNQCGVDLTYQNKKGKK
jgi:hypothetical protein